MKADERRRLPDERGEYIDCVSFLVTSQRTRPAYSSPVFVFFPPVFTVSRVDGCPSPPPSPPGEPRNSRDQGFSRAKPSCASKEEEGSREEEEVEEEEREYEQVLSVCANRIITTGSREKEEKKSKQKRFVE